MRDKQTNIRLSAEELLQVQVAAAALDMRPSSLMRMFISDGLKSFDRRHENVLARLDALQSQLEKSEAVLGAIAKHADSAFLMSASAVGFLSRLELPKISDMDPGVLRERVMKNMSTSFESGMQLKAAHESGKFF